MSEEAKLVCVSCQMPIIGNPRAVGHASDGVTHATERECVMAVRRELSALRAALDQANTAMFDAGKIYGELVLENQNLKEAIEEVMGWITSWSPEFTEDPEWNTTYWKVQQALEKTGER